MGARAKIFVWAAIALMAATCWAEEAAPPRSSSAGAPIDRVRRAPGDSTSRKSPNSNLPDGGLTFLPTLTPTDGVPTLAPTSSGESGVQLLAETMGHAPLLLDRAVAVIDGHVILASDVAAQQRFAVFMPLTAPGATLTPMQAMEQIVNRTLLEEQMAEQQLVPPPSDKEVNGQLAELRANLPACAGHHCDTEQGWKSFLAAHGITQDELYARWKEEMAILDFIGARFRTGIRITQPEVEAYYKGKLLPEFEQRNLKPPPISMVSSRIEEVLLQQHVNRLLGDYLRSLKDAGSVRILDKQYSSLGKVTAQQADADANHASGDTP